MRLFLGLLLAAVALRIWSVVSLAGDLRIREPVLDGLYYLQLAERLAAGQGWPPGPIFMTPFYPAVLAVLLRAGGSGVLAVQVLQSALGIAALVLLFLAVRRDLGVRAAWAAAGLAGLCGPMLAMESQILTESLLALLVSAALWWWPRPGQSAVRSVLFGVVCGLLAIGRGVFLLLPVGAGLLLWGRSRGDQYVSSGSVRSRSGDFLRTGVAALLGLGLALLPLAIRQTSTTGRLQVLTVNGGMNLYLGNNPYARGLYSLPPGIDLQQDPTAARSASLMAGKDLDLVHADRFYTERALAFFRGNPGRAAWLLGRKAILYWSPHEVPQIEVFSLLRQTSLPLRVAFVDFRWILPLAVLGAVAIAWRRRSGVRVHADLAPYLLLVLTGWVATILFFATGRYRVPFLPAFLGLAGLGVVSIPELWRHRRERALLSVLPLVVLAQLALPSYPRAKTEAFDTYQQGVRLARSGRDQEALQAYQRAAELQPDDGQAWHGVGAALVRLGRLPEAVEAYRRALERLPNSAITHYNLGAVYGRLGDDARALTEFRAAVELDPYDPAFRSDLGIALVRNGLKDDAIREFRAVLARDPRHASARRGLEMLGVPPSTSGSQ